MRRVGWPSFSSTLTTSPRSMPLRSVLRTGIQRWCSAQKNAPASRSTSSTVMRWASTRSVKLTAPSADPVRARVARPSSTHRIRIALLLSGSATTEALTCTTLGIGKRDATRKYLKSQHFRCRKPRAVHPGPGWGRVFRPKGLAAGGPDLLGERGDAAQGFGHAIGIELALEECPANGGEGHV